MRFVIFFLSILVALIAAFYSFKYMHRQAIAEFHRKPQEENSQERKRRKSKNKLTQTDFEGQTSAFAQAESDEGETQIEGSSRKRRRRHGKNRNRTQNTTNPTEDRGLWAIWDLFSGYYIYVTVKKMCKREIHMPMCQSTQ